MFDLTTSPEFMAALQRAVLVAVANAQIVTPGIDPENEWLTAREAMAFLRLKETAFKGFRERHKNEIITSTGPGATEVRYQLGCLQKIMRANAVGLPEPMPAFQRPHPSAPKPRKPGAAPAPAADRLFAQPFLIKS